MEKLVWLDLCKVVGARRGMKVGWGREGQKKIELGLGGWVWGLYGFVLVWIGLCCSVNFVLLVIGWKYLVLCGNCW